ncbi:MAG: diguanylate cyclase, partial [Candidatus Levybacteria bacterium]|nr:diguanylate cyclase [Candidatus Levybacteria bacterium]
EPYVVEKDGFGVRIPITVSIGGGVYKPGIDGEQFFGAVDAALYTAKRKGRNRSNILLG